MVNTASAASKEWSAKGRLSATARTTGAAPGSRCAAMTTDGSTATTALSRGLVGAGPRTDVDDGRDVSQGAFDLGGDARIRSPVTGVGPTDPVVDGRRSDHRARHLPAGLSEGPVPRLPRLEHVAVQSQGQERRKGRNAGPYRIGRTSFRSEVVVTGGGCVVGGTVVGGTVVGGTVVLGGGAVVVVVGLGALVVVVVGLGALVVVVVGLGALVVVVVGALVVVVVAFTAVVVVAGLVVVVPLVVAVVGLVVAVVEDPPAGRPVVDPVVSDVLTPAVRPLVEAATAGGTEVGADDEPGTWPEGLAPVGSGTESVSCGAVVPCPEAASGGVVVVVWALVATPAIEATTTVTTRTTPTTSAERTRVEAALRRKTGRARNRAPANWRPASAKRRREDSRFTLGLARKGWPTGAKAPSISMVSLVRSWVGTRTRTGQPLTITSSAEAGRPSGVLPAPRTTSRPPIACQDHCRSTLGSSASTSVQPVGSTKRSNAAKLALPLPHPPSTTQTFTSFTLSAILVPSPRHRPPRSPMLRVQRGSWKSNHDP